MTDFDGQITRNRAISCIIIFAETNKRIWLNGGYSQRAGEGRPTDLWRKKNVYRTCLEDDNIKVEFENAAVAIEFRQKQRRIN
jgi:hypothetical protein